MNEHQPNDVNPMAGVTEELSILSGSALPAGLSAILREGTMAKVVFAGSARSPGAPQALGLRVEVKQPLCLLCNAVLCICSQNPPFQRQLSQQGG